MKYRALAYNKAIEQHYYEYGLPSYGFNTDEIAEIGTPDGGFINVNPATFGRETGYKDITGREMYIGDITELEVNGEIRRFEVVETTLDREYNTVPGLDDKVVKVRLQGVIAFKWNTFDGETFFLLPCIDDNGVCDTEKMKIVDDIHTQAERGSRA